MKFTFLPGLLLLIACINSTYGQETDSAYYIQIGSGKYKTPSDFPSGASQVIGTVKLKYPYHIDTIMVINPVSLSEEQAVVPYDERGVYAEAKMSIADLGRQLQKGFLIQRGHTTLPLDEVYFYYESANAGGFVAVKYPNPDLNLLAKLSKLKSGDFVMLLGYKIHGRKIDEVRAPAMLISIGSGSHLQKVNHEIYFGNKPFHLEYVTTNTSCPVITTETGQVLYIGINNPVKILINGISSNDISAELYGDGSIERDPDSPFVFNVKVSQYGNYAIGIMAGIKGDAREIAQYIFKARRIPDPVLMTNIGARGGDIEKSYLKAITGLVALIENFDLPARYKVIGFSMIYESGGKLQRLHSDNELLTDAMKQLINMAQPDDLIIFEGIRVIGPDELPRNLNSLAFTVIME